MQHQDVLFSNCNHMVEGVAIKTGETGATWLIKVYELALTKRKFSVPNSPQSGVWSPNIGIKAVSLVQFGNGAVWLLGRKPSNSSAH